MGIMFLFFVVFILFADNITLAVVLVGVMNLLGAIRIYQIHFLEGGLSRGLLKALSQIFLYEKLEDE